MNMLTRSRPAAVSLARLVTPRRARCAARDIGSAAAQRSLRSRKQPAALSAARQRWPRRARSAARKTRRAPSQRRLLANLWPAALSLARRLSPRFARSAAHGARLATPSKGAYQLIKESARSASDAQDLCRAGAQLELEMQHGHGLRDPLSLGNRRVLKGDRLKIYQQALAPSSRTEVVRRRRLQRYATAPRTAPQRQRCGLQRLSTRAAMRRA